MNHSDMRREEAALGYGAWIGFWLQLAALGVAAVLGAAFASADAAPGDYRCGLILSLAAVALGFLRLRNRFDGEAAGCCARLLVDDFRNLTLVIAIFAALGLAGLFVAGGLAYGGLHDAGIALFVVSAAAVLLSLKHVFDVSERRG